MRSLITLLLAFVLVAGDVSAAARQAAQEPSPHPQKITDPCCQIAEDLYQAEFWDEAVTEYLRYLFWQPQGTWRSLCLARLTVCWQNLGRLDEALDTCLTGLSETRSQYMKNEYRLEAGDLYLRLNQESAAVSKVRRVLGDNPDPCHRLRAQTLQIRARLAQGRYNEAKSDLERLLGELENVWQQDPAEIAAMRLALNNIVLRSPEKAESFSKFVPGTGQLYVGKTGAAANAMAINGGLGLLFVESISAGDVGLGIFSFYLLRRYYHGNRHNAIRECRARNRSEIEPIAEHILATAMATECRSAL